MTNLIIFGAPGAGKGTQAKKIAQEYNLKHLSTGDLFRKEIKNETKLGLIAKDYASRGDLVPDDLVIQIVKKAISDNKNVKGLIFDGFPRNIYQAENLDKILSERNEKIDATLILEAPDNELIERITKRGKKSKRVDDQNIDIIKNRLKIYQENTKTLIDYYKKQNKAYVINGLGDIEIIKKRLQETIDKLA